MTSPISESIHRLRLDCTGSADWTRVRLGDPGFPLPESWLRDHIKAAPELVLGPCRSFGFIEPGDQWRVWNTEMSVAEVGSVDVVLVSSEGRVALVEVKLARNPESRRKVVAQLLDYAIHLRDAVMDDLPELPNDDGVAFADHEDVQRHIQDGDFLLIIASDEADERAAKLTRAVLDRNAIHPWDLALIDLTLFAPVASNDTWSELVCVPTVIGGVQCQSRHVVEVKVTNTATDASVVVQLAEPEDLVGRTRAWDAESFRQLFTPTKPSSAFRDLVFSLIAAASRSPSTTTRYGKGKYPSVFFEAGRGPFAYANRDGLWLYGRKYTDRAFGVAAADQRWREVRTLFPEVSVDKPYFMVRPADPRLPDAAALIQRWMEQGIARKNN